MDPTKRRYVLLERDGVINRRVPGGGVTSWEQFEFLPRALDALRLLAENSYIALVVSNQDGVGKGLLSSNDLDVITRRFLLEVALSGGHIAQVYYCRHTFEDLCNCHKPRPGLIVRAQIEHRFAPEDTFLVDDTPDSLRAAEGVGCPSILIRRAAFLEPPSAREELPLVACNLYEAAELILAARDIHQREPALLRQ
jgi:D-glycero-D-manno-heptose 1,7-bisphosphate phosphatase